MTTHPTPRPRRRRSFRVVLLSLFLIPLVQCSHREEPPNILWIVIDSLRADHLGAYGIPRPTSPHLDALARSATTFSKAYASAPWTSPSVASMLTGRSPSGHGVTTVRNVVSTSIPSLPSLLRESGYRTAAVVSNRLLSSRRGFGNGFESLDEQEARGKAHVSTPGVVKIAETELREFSGDPAPFFLFVHFFDPHYDYLSHPPGPFASPRAGRLRGDEDIHELRAYGSTLTPDELQFLVDRYDEEIQFTDRGVGDLLRVLGELGLNEKTIVVVTADHGDEFYDHGSLDHSATLYEEVVRVPLLYRDPRVKDRVPLVEKAQSLISIAPTLHAASGKTPPSPPWIAAPLDFTPLDSPAPKSSPIFLETAFVPTSDGDTRPPSDRKALIEGDFKIIVDENTKALELYNLALDPNELVNLVGSDSARTEAMLRAMRETHQGIARECPPLEESPFTSESERDLRSLGYVR